MKKRQLKINFSTEQFILDYISFNIQGTFDSQAIEEYFFNVLEFDVISKVQTEPRKWELVRNLDHRFYKLDRIKVEVREWIRRPEKNCHWDGTQIIFKGENAARFYHLIQRQKIDSNYFNLGDFSLGRIDLYYFREFSDSDDITQKIEDFMEKSCQKIKSQSKRKKATWERRRRKKGFILKIGSRASHRHLRVYEKIINNQKGLEFEVELKREQVSNLRNLLIERRFMEFEDILAEQFYSCLIRSLVFETEYTDWIHDRLRKINQEHQSKGVAVTDYLTKSNFKTVSDKRKLFQLFQFLAFIRTCNIEGRKEYLGQGSQAFYFVKFPLSNFIKFIGTQKKGGSRQNQLQQAKEFFLSLREFKPIQSFSDKKFQSYVIFPLVEIQKEGRLWVAKISIAEQLYNYQYPFYLPQEFIKIKHYYQVQVSMAFFCSIATSTSLKTFKTELFLKEFNISNQKKAEVKKFIVSFFNLLVSEQIIEPNFYILYKNGWSQRINELSTSVITKSTKILFYEVVNEL